MILSYYEKGLLKLVTVDSGQFKTFYNIFVITAYITCAL